MRNFKGALLAALIAGSFGAAINVKAEAQIYVTPVYGHNYGWRRHAYWRRHVYAYPGWDWGWGAHRWRVHRWHAWRGDRMYRRWY